MTRRAAVIPVRYAGALSGTGRPDTSAPGEPGPLPAEQEGKEPLTPGVSVTATAAAKMVARPSSRRQQKCWMPPYSFTNGLSMYNDGSYSSKNPGWHENDASWKARQVLSMLCERSLRPESIVDIGCGTGGVLEVIAGALNGTRLVGYDPSSQAIGMVERSDGVELRVGTPKDVHEHYDLLLSLDVFEHVEDYIGFLRSLRPIANWFVFHIPLDVSAQSVIRERPLLAARSTVGHLHYFTRGTALATVKTAGFEIVCDKLLFPNDMPGRQVKTRIANIPRDLGRHLRPRLSARIFGGSTLLVLASVQTGRSFLATP
jgi:SAM-dependent methyltransferase